MASLCPVASGTDPAFLMISGVSRQLAAFCSPVLDTGPHLRMEMNHLPQETSSAEVLPLHHVHFGDRIPLPRKCSPTEGPAGGEARRPDVHATTRIASALLASP